MPIAAALLFDGAAERILASLREEMRSARAIAVAPDDLLPPHLTLAISQSGSLDDWADELSASITIIESALLTISHIGWFPKSSTVFAGPSVTASLNRIHSLTIQMLERASGEPLLYYQPGQWVPHITLCEGVANEELGEALRQARPAVELRPGVTRLALAAIDAESRAVDFKKTWTL